MNLPDARFTEARWLRTLADIAERVGDYSDVTNKPAYIWETYEPYFAPLSQHAPCLLELGVHRGVSAKVLATYFAAGKIVGVDVALPAFDFSAFPNVALLQADQRDAVRLEAICDEHAPDGFDIIIDDASHVAECSAVSFEALFPRLKPGGLYVIEDWQTGYMPNWPDGAAPTPHPASGKRVPSHDCGMVGFVKTLIDRLAMDDAAFAWLHFHRSMVIVSKLGP